MKNRNLVFVVLLGFITLGIYAVYWLYITRKEYVAVTGDKKAILPVSLLFAPLLSLVVILPLQFIVNFMVGGEASGSGLATAINILGLLIGSVSILAFIIIPFIWFFKYCQAFSKITGGTEPILSYVIWLISFSLWLGPIWMLLVQNDINKALEAGTIKTKAQPVSATPAV